MTKIGIIGGTFDPIHNGHLYIAYEAFLKLNLDKVIFLITGNPPHKNSEKVTSAEIRMKMVKESINNFPNFEISEYEILKKEKCYTYESLRYFKNLYNESELYFITGGDCLRDLEKWKNVPEVLRLANLVVCTRGGINTEYLEKQKKYIENKYNANIIFLELLELDISSSMIREKINKRERVDFFLPEKVLKFIKDHDLYRGN